MNYHKFAGMWATPADTTGNASVHADARALVRPDYQHRNRTTVR